MADSPAAPEHGDIVIEHQHRDGKWTFFLHTAPGPNQYALPTVNEAITHANAVAKRERVRVWLRHDDDSFSLVNDFRSITS